MAELQARLPERCRTEHEAIAAAHAANERELLIDRAHKLAGIAGMLGAPEIGEAALDLEETLLAGRDADVATRKLLALLDRAAG